MPDSDVTKISFSDGDKLVGASNNMVWAFIVEQILREKGLWYIIENNDTVTLIRRNSTGSEIETEAQSQRTISIADRQRDVERVIIIITKTVSASVIPTVMTFRSDPTGLWVALKNQFESAALQRKLDLKTSLILCKMPEGSSIQDYLQKIRNYVVELGCVGEKVPEAELIQIVLRNLPDSWYTFTSVYGVMFSKGDDLKFSALQEYMMAEEARVKARQGVSELSLMASTERRSEYNHQFNNTRHYPSQGRGRGRGRTGRGRGAGRPECNFCSKRGHWEHDCFIKNANSEMKSLSVSQLRDLQ
ncbi:unnamed protein product [Calypogeia fissa]